MIEAPAEHLDIIYQDQWLVAINKPSGLLVHRSMIDRHETRLGAVLFLRHHNPDISVTPMLRGKEKRAVLW